MDGLTGLRVFALVAELRSFSEAADRLGLSPAMVSKHVQGVEARVGARLLNRTSRSVSMTEAGTVYLATVRSLLDGLDQTEAQLAQTALSPGVSSRSACRSGWPIRPSPACCPRSTHGTRR